MKSKVRNMLSVTTPEQSRQMLEFGYSIDTADMVWVKSNYQVSFILQEKETAESYSTDSYSILPAWSLLRLYQMLPPYLEVEIDEETGECVQWYMKIDKYRGVSYIDDKGQYLYEGNTNSITPIDNLVEAFIWFAKDDWMYAVDEEFNSIPKEIR